VQVSQDLFLCFIASFLLLVIAPLDSMQWIPDVACIDVVAMLFTLHPGNVSASDATVATAAAASPTSALDGYEPQPLPLWTNATQVHVATHR